MRALRVRDHSAATLDARLARRGFDADARHEAIGRLQELGYLDDARFADARAKALAARGYGNLLIADDLERNGVPPDVAVDAIARIEPELARAAAVVEQRGASSRTARLLTARGFAYDTVEAAVAAAVDEPIG